jgi:hypothetical protein
VASVIQRSFAGGVLTPDAAARADQSKYATGLRTCRNFVVLKHGGVANRAGTEFIDEVKDSDDVTRLLKFVFNAEQTYVLEFGDRYIRFYQDGERLATSGVAAYAAGTAYAVADLVVSVGITYYCIQAGTGHTPATSALYWYPLTGSVYEVPSPYLSADLADLQFKQSGDIVTIVSRDYAPRELARLGQTQWTLTVLNTGSPTDAPDNVLATPGSAVSAGLGIPAGVTAIGGDSAGVADLNDADQYRVAAYDDSPVRIGVASALVRAQLAGPGAYSRATGAAPVTISWSAVASAQGYAVYKKFHGAGAFGLIAITEATTWDDEDAVVVGNAVSAPHDTASGGTAFVYVVTAIDDDSGAESVASAEATCTGSTPTASDPNVIAWDAVAGASSYNVYRKVDGKYAFIGTASGTSFDDVNYEPGQHHQPAGRHRSLRHRRQLPAGHRLLPAARGPGVDRQRPRARAQCSRTGEFRNFTVSSPLQDDDAVTFILRRRPGQRGPPPLRGRRQVRHPHRRRRVDPSTPTADQALLAQPQAVHLQRRGQPAADHHRLDAHLRPGARLTVRDAIFATRSTGYKGNDLSIFSAHLFDGYTLVDWDYQRAALDGVGRPQRRRAARLDLHPRARARGAGITRHLRRRRSRTSVRSPRATRTRSTSSSSARSAARPSATSSACTAADHRHRRPRCSSTAALSYDGRNTGATTMTLSGSGWTYQDTLTLTASAASSRPPTWATRSISSSTGSSCAARSRATPARPW